MCVCVAVERGPALLDLSLPLSPKQKEGMVFNFNMPSCKFPPPPPPSLYKHSTFIMDEIVSASASHAQGKYSFSFVKKLYVILWRSTNKIERHRIVPIVVGPDQYCTLTLIPKNI